MARLEKFLKVPGINLFSPILHVPDNIMLLPEMLLMSQNLDQKHVQFIREIVRHVAKNHEKDHRTCK